MLGGQSIPFKRESMGLLPTHINYLLVTSIIIDGRKTYGGNHDFHFALAGAYPYWTHLI